MATEHNSGSGDPGRIAADIGAIERDEERLARDTDRLERDLKEQHRHVDVQVNNNNSVRLIARRDNGTADQGRSDRAGRPDRSGIPALGGAR